MDNVCDGINRVRNGLLDVFPRRKKLFRSWWRLSFVSLVDILQTKLDNGNQKRDGWNNIKKEMINVDFAKHLPTVNFLLMVVILVFIVPNKCEPNSSGLSELEKQRLEHIDSSINVLNAREPIEKKMIIIDNETLQKINFNDTIRDPRIIDSLFARFNDRVDEFKRR